MDLNDVKSNSDRSKADQKNELEEKRAHKVVKNSVTEKKPSKARKFASLIVPEDVEDIRDYIWNEVVVPATKNIISDVIDTILFGSIGGRRGNRGGRTNYNKISTRRSDDRTSVRRSSNFKEVIFDSAGDAEEVLDCMDEILEKYGSVRVADYNELVGKSGSYTDNRYGWDDLRDARVVRDGGGYRIKLPRPLPL